MNTEIQKLREEADKAKVLYAQRLITREEAKRMVVPFVDAYNTIAKEKAKKWNVPAKLLNWQSYIR